MLPCLFGLARGLVRDQTDGGSLNYYSQIGLVMADRRLQAKKRYSDRRIANQLARRRAG